METCRYFHSGTHWIVQVFLNIACAPSFNRGREALRGLVCFFVPFFLGWWGRCRGTLLFRRDAVEIMDGSECSVEVSLGDISIVYFMPFEHERRVLCRWGGAFGDEEGLLGQVDSTSLL